MSVAGDVATAVETAITALALSGVTVVRRKTPTLPEGTTAALPQVVVSIEAEGEVEQIDYSTDLVRYPVAVTIVTADGKNADDDAVRGWRQQIRRAVEARATWSGLSGWNAIGITGRAPFDASALSKDLNYSTIVFTVEVLEPRT